MSWFLTSCIRTPAREEAALSCRCAPACRLTPPPVAWLPPPVTWLLPPSRAQRVAHREVWGVSHLLAVLHVPQQL